MRRLGVTLVAAAVAFGAVLALPVAAVGAAEGDGGSAGSGVSVTRYGGADRYETSLQVAEAVAADADGSLEWVVLVSGRRWTDAVVAAPVAGALGAPVLMTPPGELRADALAFLQRAGVSKALVVGPDASGGAHGPGRGVGAEVLAALDEAGISAERVAGDDLYGTGVAAAGRVTPGAMGDLGPTAVIASGEVFADALVAGPFAARGIHPVLLSPPGELHAEVAAYLASAGIEHVVLMGGTAALSEAVGRAVEDLGIDVSRVAGSTRYDTAVKAAELAQDQYSAAVGRTCFANDTIGVARARVPFDSFSAAPLLGRLCAPLVLADPGKVPDDTAAYLDAARDQHDAVGLRVFGGDAAVSQAAIDAYLTGEEPETGDDGESADGEPDGGEADTAPGVLPAGTCGGAIDNEPSQFPSSASAEDPAWSPDCSQLVYSQNGSLWTMNNDGTNQQRLTSRDGSFSDEPVWSPDGTQIAYARGRTNDDGNWFSHIYVVNADGTGRTKVSKGDVSDSHPSWSPDGTRIAFGRRFGDGRDEDGNYINPDSRIATISLDGSDMVLLDPTGSWERTPAWSPDGASIAFVARRLVWTMSVDGTDPRPVSGGALWNGGLSWSPDGTRLAFSNADSDGGADVVVAPVDGIGERQLTDLPGWSMLPRWSPDGASIAFTHFDQTSAERDVNGARFASVVGAEAGEPLAWAAACRPRGVRHTTAGFPLPDWAPSSTGSFRVAVLFIDFPDAQAEHSPQEEADSSLAWAEEYLEAASYGKLDVEFVPHYTWQRSEQSHTHYHEPSSTGRVRVSRAASQEAVTLADAEFDFSDVDTVMTVLPRTHFHSGSAGGFVSADDADVRQVRVNSHPSDEPRAFADVSDWGSTAAHELAHALGLLDMYPFDRSLHELPEAPSGQAWINADFGLMHLDSYFLSAHDDPRRRVVWRHRDGRVDTGYAGVLNPREMLAWSRWQLSWLDPDQAQCVTESSATVTLSPAARPGDAVAMAAIPVNQRQVIVVESRRELGYDRAVEYAYTEFDGWQTEFPSLIEEGVLVYTVDALFGAGELPVKIAGDSGNGIVDDFPVLQAGESVTLHGYTVTVTADDGDTHTVSITRND
ncbi:MAG: cell wall-binding repeat-containing protein [Acidimicrobiaceae bacterium]|nr:cell wall-binding repeat-containing protein [Acidimicrobiaceae bacterium]